MTITPWVLHVCKYFTLKSQWQTPRKHGALVVKEWPLGTPFQAVCLVNMCLVPPGRCSESTQRWTDLLPLEEQAFVFPSGPALWEICFGAANWSSEIQLVTFQWKQLLSNYIVLYGKTKRESKSLVYPCLLAGDSASYTWP